MKPIDDRDILEAITERIFDFIDAEQLSYADFAASIDIGAAVVSHMKNGRNKVSLNVYAKILDSFPHINPDWLLSGKGSMYRESSQNIYSRNSQSNLFTTQAEEVKTHVKSTSPSPQQQLKAPENLAMESKKVSRVVIFYDDNSFQEFMP